MTDLEGSTAHLRVLGDEYASALARHHEIVRAALAAERGVEVGSEGDSFAAILPGTAAALRAAVGIQLRLVACAWPDSPWRVRIGIHAGPVEIGAAGAVGLSLHEAARIRAVVHGGQIVVSENARRAIDEPVRVEIGWTDLGLHTVRDFDSPVRLHQVSAPGLPSEFPPLRTMATRAVPTARTRFIGRKREVDALLESLSTARLVTVTGAGGSGKTRLAYEAARQSEVDAVTVVELAGLRDASQVDAEVARAVGARQPDEIISTIGGRDLMVVIDNCEHVMPRIALLVSELLDACEGLVVLTTSREPLGVAGEMVWQMPQLQSHDAVELFRVRALREVRDESLVRTACERLGWMPLAIELAAARVRSVRLEDLVNRLDDQLRLLNAGARDVPRQQTLRATLDWSHNLLSEDERVVFRRLGVFAGGFSLEAAEAVVTRASDVDVLDAIDGLVLKSLLDISPESDRYRMLEPVRQYAVDQLRAATEDESTYECLAVWAAQAAAAGNRNLFTEQQRHWTSVLDAERDNFGAAISWALDNGRIPLATTTVISLAWYWFTSGRNDGLVWVPRVLAVVDSLEARDRAKTLLAAGITYCDSVRDDRPLEWLSEAGAIFRRLDHERGLSSALFWLGRAAAARQDSALSALVFTECAALSERIGDLFAWGWSMSWLGSFARRRGDLDESERIQQDLIVRCGDIPHVVGAALSELAIVAAERGEIEDAITFHLRSLEIFRGLGDRWQIAMAIRQRAGLTLSVSLDISAASTVEALKQFRELGADPDMRGTLAFAAGLLLTAGRREEAAIAAGAGGIEGPMPLNRYGSRPTPYRELMSAVWALPDDPDLARPLKRGGRLGVHDAADAAIEWLERAYPASASISV